MKRQCSNCGSINVRRSGTSEAVAAAYRFRSPYRCRECDARFWVISRRTYVGAIAGATILALALLVWAGHRAIEYSHLASMQPASATNVIAPVLPGSATSTKPLSMEDVAAAQAEARSLSEFEKQSHRSLNR
jgi:hypothetical protein